MKKLYLIITILLYYSFCYSQKAVKLSAYLSTQINITTWDQTTGNNPWGIGLGSQFFLLNKSKLRPTIEVTFDGYPQDDQVLRYDTITGKGYDDVGTMFNILAGLSYHPNKIVFFH